MVVHNCDEVALNVSERISTMNAVALSDPGIDADILRDDTLPTLEDRAEKVNQDTTLSTSDRYYVSLRLSESLSRSRICLSIRRIMDSETASSSSVESDRTFEITYS